jgi:predicted ATPase with chaperone activity
MGLCSLGELALDGTLRPIKSTINITQMAKNLGTRKFFCKYKILIKVD